jgi:hypothetical protein
MSSAQSTEIGNRSDLYTHQGYLWKQGHGWIFKTWRKRYFVLNREGLSYYEDDTLNVKKGFFPLYPGSMLHPVSDNTTPSQYKNCFFYGYPDETGSVTSDHVLIMSAETPAEREKWISSIKKIKGWRGSFKMEMDIGPTEDEEECSDDERLSVGGC